MSRRPPPNLLAEAIFTNANHLPGSPRIPADIADSANSHAHAHQRFRITRRHWLSPTQTFESRTRAPNVPRPRNAPARPCPTQASESRTRAPNVPRGEMNAPAFASVTVIPCSRSRATAASASRTVSAIMNIPSP